MTTHSPSSASQRRTASRSDDAIRASTLTPWADTVELPSVASLLTVRTLTATAAPMPTVPPFVTLSPSAIACPSALARERTVMEPPVEATVRPSEIVANDLAVATVTATAAATVTAPLDVLALPLCCEPVPEPPFDVDCSSARLRSPWIWSSTLLSPSSLVSGPVSPAPSSPSPGAPLALAVASEMIRERPFASTRMLPPAVTSRASVASYS